MQLEFDCAIAKHPGEPDGRVAFVHVSDPFAAALLLNTPWPLDGELMPIVMARAAQAALQAPHSGNAAARASAMSV
jgi:hypothetical protein